jgi:parvulin-like peptidyl-prolyl isomerase
LTTIVTELVNPSKAEPLPFSLEQLRWLSRAQLLPTVLRALIADPALASVSLTDEERLQAFQSFCTDQQLTNPEQLEGYRQQQLLEQEDLQFLIERPLRLSRLCEQQYLPKADARFLERKTGLDQIVYSLLRVSDGGLARELYLRIAGQETDFPSAATEYSLGPESKSRGLVGPVPLLQAHPTLAQRLRTNPPGQLIEPFQIEQWWVVVRVESYTPAVLDDTTRMAMAKELFEEWLEGELKIKLSQIAEQLQSNQEGVELP